MSRLTVHEVDALIAELDGLQQQQADITARRKQIREMLTEGRHEGTHRDIRKAARGQNIRLDKDRLRLYVNDRIIEKCSLISWRDGSVMVVPKLKQRKAG